ncbi:MAG TPA: class I SAM-dependent methyltransferase [Chitinophagales bacterium]|nr:class I SAM-dependent methyltransferase [Chitinophagales bacterium]
MSLYTFIRRYYKGVSWTNQTVSALLKTVDPIDNAVLRVNGLKHLPKFSARVRSNGIRGQFGGKRFNHYGKLTAWLLQTHAGLAPNERVLEIGCGTGRTALGLAHVLREGRYTGMDIEPYSISTCLTNPLLQRRKFSFDLIDIYNREYNPTGKFKPDAYVFPYANESFDVIFMVSVFTHMLAPDVKHYIREFARMLKPGGRVFITTFLMDDGHEFESMKFPFRRDEAFVQQEELPEFAVGYHYQFYVDQFLSAGMQPYNGPLKGHWRTSSLPNIVDTFPQDIVVFTKPA